MSKQINKALQRRLAEFKEKSGMNQSQMARGIGCAAAAVSMYLNGSYADKGGNYDTIEPKIEAFLALEAERAARQELEIAFVETKTVRRIAEVMRDAHQGGEVAVIYGQAGLGKTRAVRHYCEGSPAAVLVEANPSFTARVLMQKLAEGCKVSAAGSLNEVYEAVADRLRDTGRLIVVDEAENLPLRALEILRRLHDETDCG
ncbi:DNA transposition AAA+ family ATPase, partial [Neisseria perflava]|uniref:AAA family ATPase n=1 Tax=Neisseria perflava TaxID=33053 RepID=UPI00209FFC48